MSTNFTGCFIEYHILQSFPVTCLNRDGVGEPKSAIIGGVPRARISSQCFKRQVRLYAKNLGVKLGIRTKHIEDLIYKGLLASGGDDIKSRECASAIASTITKDTLLFISEYEISQFVKYIKDLDFKLPDFSKKSDKNKMIAQCMSQVFKDSDGLDIALFGRMVAQAPEIDVKAASSFAHAISTHACRQEFDYFTALDDLQEEKGSGHLGTIEYNSATYYRYIVLDLGQLATNIEANDIENIDKVIDVFTKSLYAAIPEARQSTMTGACLWDYARILVRRGPCMQISFDKPVKAKGEGFLKPSIEALNEYIALNEARCGSMYNKYADITFGGETSISIDNVCSSLKDAVKKSVR